MPVQSIRKIDGTTTTFRLQFDSAPSANELLTALARIPQGQKNIVLTAVTGATSSVVVNPTVLTFQTSSAAETDVPVA